MLGLRNVLQLSWRLKCVMNLQPLCSYRHCSTNDVDALNQELDEFFGARNTAGGFAQPSSSTPPPYTSQQPHHHPSSMASASQRIPQHSPHSPAIHTRHQHAEAPPIAFLEAEQELHSTLSKILLKLEDRPGAAGQHLEGSLSTSGQGHSTSTQEQIDTLTHVDARGQASMVDVGQKQHTERVAEASARVLLGEAAFRLVQDNKMKKGDVLTVAQLAGIMGSKSTSSLIPLCHPIALTKVDVRLSLDEATHCVRVWAQARAVGQTGVEMEALTAASVAALTVYDMCKAVSKAIVISDLRLEFKKGGKSGVYRRLAC